MARPEKVRLGEILVQQKLLSEEQLGLALADQKRTGRKLGRVFVENGFVTEEQISGAIARQLDIPYINLKFYNTSPDVVRLLPETQSRRFRALVLEDRRTSLLVGMSDPTDLFAYDEIARLVKKTVELAVVTETEVLQAIDRIYRRTEEITDFARELEQDLGDSLVDFGALAANPGLEEAPIVKLLQSVFDDATQVRASDIHIEPQESRLQIRFRIDGVLHLQTEADIKIATPLALRLKLMADLDISEKRLPQDGRFAMKVKQQRVDVRISTMPTQYGESVVMRLLNQGGTTLAARRDRHAGAAGREIPRHRAAPQRPGAGHRPDRQRQDHHLVQRAGRTELGREEADHGRGPGRVPAARHQPGAGQRQDRAHVSRACCARRCGRIRTSCWWARCATRKPPRSACAPR